MFTINHNIELLFHLDLLNEYAIGTHLRFWITLTIILAQDCVDYCFDLRRDIHKLPGFGIYFFLLTLESQTILIYLYFFYKFRIFCYRFLILFLLRNYFYNILDNLHANYLPFLLFYSVFW